MNPEIAKTSKVCTVCNVIVTGDGNWQAHIQGKRHQQATGKHDDRYEKSQRSIYVGNLPPGTNETILFNYFMRYADVTEVIMDKNQGKFAIIEFATADSISYVLGQKHFLSDRRLVVQPRKLKTEPKGPPKREVQQAEEARSNEELCDQVFSQLLISSNMAEQMDDLVNILKLPNQEIDMRSRFIQELTQMLRSYFSYSEVHVYGSSANGLGQIGCDLDILVSLRPESDEYYQVEETGNHQKSAKQLFQAANRGYKINPEQLCDLSIRDVTFLLKLILSKVPHCHNILLIPSKRCPIVRFTHSELGISCDVSVKHRLCLYNTNLIRLLTHLDRRALLLFFTLKYWAKVHDIGGGGGARFSSYSIVMLVIFYLQNTEPQLLPSIMQLREIEGQSRMIASWECSFCHNPSRIPISKNRQPVDELLKNFFHFYAGFNFTNFVVCPRTGLKFYSKANLVEFTPNAMEKPLFVQDPFELSHNLTGNVNDKVIGYFLDAIHRGRNWAKSSNMWVKTRNGSTWGILCLFEPFLPSPAHSVQPRLQAEVEAVPPRPHEQRVAPQLDAKSSVSFARGEVMASYKSTTKQSQQSEGMPSQQSSYWSSQKPSVQATVQQPASQVGKATFWSTAKRDVSASAPVLPTGADIMPMMKPQPAGTTKTQLTPVKMTPVKTVPSHQPQVAGQKPVSELSEEAKLVPQKNESNAVLPSPIRAWPPITSAVIQQPTKRKRKSKLKTPANFDGDASAVTFLVVPFKPVAEKLVGAPQSAWGSMLPEKKENWSKMCFQVVYATFSDALQMPCSEMEITKGSDSNVSNSDGGSSAKRLKTEANNSPATKEVGKDIPDSGALTASFLCSVYHRTWEKRRHLKQRLVPTTPLKPYLEVEEKISMLIIESVESTPEKPLFSFKCRIESTQDLCQFKVTMIPMMHSTEFVGVAVDFYKSYIPKVVLKALEERAL